jgi:RND superfamily putative drug exporter
MSSLTRWVLAHKRIVVAFWIAMTVGGVLAAGPATAALTQEFSVPNKEGSVTNVEIAKRYAGTGGESVPLLPVVTLPAGKTVESPGVRRDLAKVDATLERALPGARIASYASTGDRVFASKDGRTVYALVYPPGSDESDFGGNPGAAQTASRALAGATVAGAPIHVTGFDALADQSGGSEGPGVLAEAIIGGAGALVVLLFVFASFLAVVPLVMAIVSIMTTFVLLLGLTELTRCRRSCSS